MDAGNRSLDLFTAERLETVARVWSLAAVRLVDIRRRHMGEQEPFHYTLPASTLIYTRGGHAEVSLDQAVYHAERFGIFHGGKGTDVSIRTDKGELDIYLLLYKADFPPAYKQELMRLLDQFDPFRQRYGFAPGDPLFFERHVPDMYRQWQSADPLRQFYEKTAFHRLFYEVYSAIGRGDIHVFQPDIAAQAVRFIDKHYRSNVTVKQVQELLHISSAQLNRLMKKKTGKTPQEYLMHVRLDAAKVLLTRQDVTLREIAREVGFYDEYHLSHAFKRSYGLTPIAFRRNLAFRMRNPYIDNDYQSPYNEFSSADIIQLKEGIERSMHSKTKHKPLLALALGLTLLSACSSAPAQPSASESPNAASASPVSSPSQSASAQPSASESATRIVSTSAGEVEVPAHPQRVLTTNLIGDLIALGVTPIAAPEHEANTIAYRELAAPVPLWKDLNPELVTSYEPDLILVYSKEQYDAFSKIAPTVLFPFFELSAQDRVTALGDVLNKQEEAKRVLADYNAKVADAKRQLEEANRAFEGQTFSILEFIWGGLYVYGDSFGRGGDIVYNGLGLQAPEVVRKEVIAGEQWRELSMEVLPEYAGDYILLSGDVDKISENPVWDTLPAVKNGKVIPLDFDLFYHNDIYSADNQLEYLLDKLLEAASS